MDQNMRITLILVTWKVVLCKNRGRMCLFPSKFDEMVKSMLAEKHAMKIRLSRNAIPREVSLTLNVFFAKIFSTRKKHSGIERKEKRRCDNEVAR